MKGHFSTLLVFPCISGVYGVSHVPCRVSHVPAARLPNTSLVVGDQQVVSKPSRPCWGRSACGRRNYSTSRFHRVQKFLVALHVSSAASTKDQPLPRGHRALRAAASPCAAPPRVLFSSTQTPCMGRPLARIFQTLSSLALTSAIASAGTSASQRNELRAGRPAHALFPAWLYSAARCPVP
jgi:hypothetical protein